MHRNIEWQMSKRKNHYTSFGGVTTTIFKDKFDRGYKICIVGPGGDPIYPRSTFASVQKAKEAAEDLLFADLPDDDDEVHDEIVAIQRKIDALMRLAERPGTPAEGESALRMANELAEKYQVPLSNRIPS